MKKLILALICTLLFTSVFAEDQLKKPYMLKNEKGEIINTGGLSYAAPYFGDFDGDGKDDLLLGFWEKRVKGGGAKLYIYKNNGTNENPNYLKRELFNVDNKVVELYGY